MSGSEGPYSAANFGSASRGSAGFGKSDLIADADAYLSAMYIGSGSRAFYDAFGQVLTIGTDNKAVLGNPSARVKEFYVRRFGSKLGAASAIRDLFTSAALPTWGPVALTLGTKLGRPGQVRTGITASVAAAEINEIVAASVDILSTGKFPA